MQSNTNSTTVPPPQISSAYIDGLCDVVPNSRRTDADFTTLLQCLQIVPKECTPFKGKILQHLQVHGLGNPNINLRLLSQCYARTAILFRKTPNKSEGALGAWKSSLLSELRTLEENLGELYKTVGLTTNNIIDKDSNIGDEAILKSVNKLKESKQDYEGIINEYLLRVNLASYNICALISVPTDFSLPIPVLVLLRMATKAGSLRWNDYKKKPDGLIRNHVYSMSPYLVDLQLRLTRQIVNVLGTDIIPFTPYINQSLIRILEWTRSSNLLKHDEKTFHQLRSEVFKVILLLLQRLSLSINLEPKLLQTLLETELIENLEKLSEQQLPSTCRDQHFLDAIQCLEHLLITYNELLDAPLEKKVKSFVIQTCVKIYRDFSSNTFNLASRKHLLQLLQIISSQPIASSTTEIAHNILYMVHSVEREPEMKALSLKILKLGFSHHPIIVTQHEVYSRYGDSVLMTNAPEQPLNGIADNGSHTQHNNLVEKSNPLDSKLTNQNGLADKQSKSRSDSDIIDTELPFVDASQNLPSISGSPVKASNEAASPKIGNHLASSSGDPPTAQVIEREDDADISYYMNQFVEKPCV